MQETMTPEEVRKLMSGGNVPKRLMAAKRHGRGIRPDNSVMNRTELAYSLELERLKSAGQIFGWKFHAFTLTIADPPNAKCARWTPDFAVWTNDMILEFHECKGHMEDHALVRIKCAADQFPHPVWVVKKMRGGVWKRTRF